MTKINNDSLAVAALKNGTVIDRINPEALFKVADLLDIKSIKSSVTIGVNLDSKHMGKKGIIKVADTFFSQETLNRIALISPQAKVNIIHDYCVTEKRLVSLPDTLIDLVKCNNPKCITNNEPMPTVFHVVDRAPVTLRCHYCEHKVQQKELTIK
ncbi:MAG: aspartate carbamoyltransferase regulatory subunit [Bacteroidales bacterium]|nr:aspartate carbamoyltransferase regulatory subunit [Bacteroidales bacterium]